MSSILYSILFVIHSTHVRLQVTKGAARSNANMKSGATKYNNDLKDNKDDGDDVHGSMDSDDEP